MLLAAAQLALGLVIVCADQNVPDFAAPPPPPKTGAPVFAFNGKDLTGFYTYLHDNKLEDPKQVFTVVDGVIRVSGEEYGAITTKEEFENYHLIVEWRWGGKTFAPREKATRDSGILLHCVGADGVAGGQWMESIECQLIEGGSGDIILVGGKSQPSLTCEVKEHDKQLYFQPGGEVVTRNSGRINWWGRDPNWKDEIDFRGPRDVEKPVGEWNRMEVIADGDSLTYILNGKLVNAGKKSSHTRGKLQFQSEGAEIHFRKIEIRPLER